MFAALLNLANRGASPDPLRNSPGLPGLREKIAAYKTVPWPEHLLDGSRFVVFDTETTGFYPHKGDEIVSLGAVVVEKGRITGDCFYRLVNPLREIPQTSTEITGITSDMVLDASDVLTVLDEFLDFTGFTVLVAHSAPFDLGFINAKLRRYCSGKLAMPVLDTYCLSQMLYPTRGDHTLDNLARIYNISTRGRHTALGDSEITARLFLALVEDLTSRGVYTTSQMFSRLQYFKSLV